MESKWNRRSSLPAGVPDWMDHSDTPLAQLVRQLRVNLTREVRGGLPPHRVELALQEACAHASMTANPELWLPELAREKSGEAHRWWRRQQEIRTRSALSFPA